MSSTVAVTSECKNPAPYWESTVWYLHTQACGTLLLKRGKKHCLNYLYFLATNWEMLSYQQLSTLMRKARLQETGSCHWFHIHLLCLLSSHFRSVKTFLTVVVIHLRITNICLLNLWSRRKSMQSCWYHGAFIYVKTQEPILPIEPEGNTMIQEHFLSISYEFIVNSNNITAEGLAFLMLLSE